MTEVNEKMKCAPIYDIRTSENALNTLVNLTGVTPLIWDRMRLHRSKYRWEDDWVEAVIRRYGHFPPSYELWDFICFHITTSANQCSSFKRHGILDLKHSYQCEDSELREFLETKGVRIDIENCALNYGKLRYDISYGKQPFETDTKAYACYSIGRKFYYDFTICGFLSVWNESPYEGNIHYRPEIMEDIDNILNLTLSQEWHTSHKPYEITVVVPGTDIVYDGYDESSDNDKILNFLTKAYITAFGAPPEEIVLMKNNIQIPPDRIVNIAPLNCW